jgi:predicted nucleic acid-binding Zn ribbon protein
MPLYVYALVNPDGSDGETYEIFQSMKDEPLKKHPETGKKVRKLLTSPNVVTKWGESASRDRMSDKNLERLGFTKYVKSGDGSYDKTAGMGPKKFKKKR